MAPAGDEGTAATRFVARAAAMTVFSPLLLASVRGEIRLKDIDL
jgi:hypothetical protein